MNDLTVEIEIPKRNLPLLFECAGKVNASAITLPGNDLPWKAKSWMLESWNLSPTDKADPIGDRIFSGTIRLIAADASMASEHGTKNFRFLSPAAEGE